MGRSAISKKAEATQTLPITVLVQTKNEEASIETCLRSLRAFDEIVVVDSNSTDRTQQLAKALGAKIVVFSWNRRYPKKKQWQLDNVETRNDWVLFLDADERPTKALIQELQSLFRVGRPVAAAYDIPLDYVFAGTLLRHGHRVVKRALVNRTLVSFPPVDDLGAPGMGELEGHYQPVVVGTAGRLRSPLLHDDPDPVSTWLERHNRYSDWEAYLRRKPDTRNEVGRLRSRQGRLFNAAPGKPLLFFAYCYLFRGGFLDGRAGFDYAVGLSFYYWQIGLKLREQDFFHRQQTARSDAR